MSGSVECGPNIHVSFSTQNIVSKFGFMLVSCKVLREMTSVFGGHMSDGHLLAVSTKARILCLDSL